MGKPAHFSTKDRILGAAEELFAQHGFAGTSLRQVTSLAAVNIAAVNYHFGSKEGLYATVLEEAHARLVSIDLVTKATQSGAEPAEKLRTLLRQIVGEIARRAEGRWELRVLSREVLAPTPMMDRMIANQIQPKFKLVSTMIAGVLGVPANHPAVSRCTVSIIGPCGFLLITDPQWQKQVFPSMNVDPDTLVDHMVTFALGGLNAVAASLKRAQR